MAPTPTELQRLATVISRRTGMALPSTRLPFLTARARAVMAWAGADNWDSWLSELEASAGNDDRVGEALDEALQVHETCFFRYPGHHALLSDVVLPDSLAAGATRLRILSVGCSTGQEAYSLAMTARENLGGDAHRQVEILGVDVGRAALRRGGYLFLGHAEGVTPPVDNFRAIHRPSGVVFQRIPA